MELDGAHCGFPDFSEREAQDLLADHDVGAFCVRSQGDACFLSVKVAPRRVEHDQVPLRAATTC